MDDSFIKQVLQSLKQSQCRRITSLDLSDTSITVLSLRAVFESLVKLRSLSLRECSTLKGTDLAAFFTEHHENVAVSDSSAGLLKCFSKLRKLDLAQNVLEAVTSEVVQSIASSFHRLTYINLSGCCSTFTNVSLKALLTSNSSMKVLLHHVLAWFGSYYSFR